MIEKCCICGHSEFRTTKVLWNELINAWQLSAEEVSYIERQQGLCCVGCGSNLRSISLANAILSSFEYDGLFIDFVESQQVTSLRVLEINEAGMLTTWLSKIPQYRMIRYPEYDMTKLNIETDTFDLVVHSDTLEHVNDPLAGLSECSRVLVPGGRCIFTIPVIIDRLTRSRKGMSNCYHGVPETTGNDLIVHTEFGADFWQMVLQAGFDSCTLHSAEFPSGLAMEAKVKRRQILTDTKLEWTGERYLPELSGTIALEHIHRYIAACKFAKDKDVLDIACGEGYGSSMIAGVASRVIGVDISEEAVNHASAKYQKDNLEFHVGCCAEIPLLDSSVDLVVSFETIEHHDQHDKMFREIKRVLRPDGVLIISSPDKYEFTDVNKQSTPYHVKELYRDEFEKLMHSSFENVAFAGQRVVSGSAIFFQDVISGTCSYIKEKDMGKETPGLSRALYFIAVASDMKLPELTSSILEASSLNVVQADELIHKLNLEVLEKNEQLHQRNLEVIEKDKMLHERNLEVIEKDKMLHERNLEVIEKDKMLHERNLDIAVLEESLKLANRSLLAKLKDKLNMNSMPKL